MTPPQDRGRQLASALNEVTAHRHPSHRHETPECACRRDPLRYLLTGGSAAEWTAQIATILASRGRVLDVDDYLATEDVEVHVIRLRDREVVERSQDGVWRAGADDARHRITSTVRALSRSALAWVVFSIFVAAVIAGLVVMFAHTAQTVGH